MLKKFIFVLTGVLFLGLNSYAIEVEDSTSEDLYKLCFKEYRNEEFCVLSSVGIKEYLYSLPYMEEVTPNVEKNKEKNHKFLSNWLTKKHKGHIEGIVSRMPKYYQWLKDSLELNNEEADLVCVETAELLITTSVNILQTEIDDDDIPMMRLNACAKGSLY